MEGNPITPELACAILLNGISAGDFSITTHDTYSLLRICGLGAVPRNNILVDLLFSGISIIVATLYPIFIYLRLDRSKAKIR